MLLAFDEDVKSARSLESGPLLEEVEMEVPADIDARRAAAAATKPSRVFGTAPVSATDPRLELLGEPPVGTGELRRSARAAAAVDARLPRLSSPGRCTCRLS